MPLSAQRPFELIKGRAGLPTVPVSKHQGLLGCGLVTGLIKPVPSVAQLTSLALLCSIFLIYICFPESSSCHSKLVPSSTGYINIETNTGSNMTHQPSCPMSPHKKPHDSLRTIESVYLCKLYSFWASLLSSHWPCPRADPHPQPFSINRCPQEHNNHTIRYILSFSKLMNKEQKRIVKGILHFQQPIVN